MKSRFDRILLAAALAALVAPAMGCVAHASVSGQAVLVATPPPPPPTYSVMTCPAGHAYVDGRYHWNGYAWVWVQPKCMYKPGYVWVGPSYVHVTGGVKYHGGYWKPAPSGHKVKHGHPTSGKKVKKGHPPAAKKGSPPPKPVKKGNAVKKGHPVK